MFAGGLIGAIAVRHGWPAAPLLLATVVLAGVTVAAATIARARAAWTDPG